MPEYASCLVLIIQYINVENPARKIVPEIIDPVFAKTSPKRSFCMTENESFGLVFVKTGSINSGIGLYTPMPMQTFINPLFAYKIIGTPKQI